MTSEAIRSPSREFMVRQAVLNVAFSEMRLRMPNNPPEMTRHWLRGRFGDAAFGGHRGGLEKIVATIQDEFSVLASRYRSGG